MLRVGREAIVTFPNFGHWSHRMQVLRGRMPVSKNLPYQWYDTPNIHLCTVADFDAFCAPAVSMCSNASCCTTRGGYRWCRTCWLARHHRFRHGAPLLNRRACIARRFATMPAMGDSRPRLATALFNRRMLICVFTGFSSGLPLYILINLLPAWLRTEHVDLKAIGLFALIGLPFTWKFIWSPLVDRYALPCSAGVEAGCWSHRSR
jgi:hypothetical protein